jgi:two-component system alkaline phosphatase synthesis response regulator PhoP
MPKVLIVDDDPDFVDATKAILENKSYDVQVAYDGVEGLERVRGEKPDLIVLDVMMPNKDGYKVCQELKANAEYQDIPVILLTAVGDKVSETRYTTRMGMEIEAEDYIPKQVEPAELVKRIEALL